MLAPQSFALPNVIGVATSETAVVSGALNKGFIVAAGSNGGALLPALAVTPEGFTVTIVNASSTDFTIFPQAGDEINAANTATVASRTTSTLVKRTIANKTLWWVG
jgi:hypothetical protein